MANDGQGDVTLYGLTLSPFVARVRLALALKAIPYRLEPVPGDKPSGEVFRRINPVGKVPVLVWRDGLVVIESETIIDYLDDVCPEPPLMPPGAADRARAGTVIRLIENYVTPALARLYVHLAPEGRDLAVVDAEWGRILEALALIDAMLSGDNDVTVGPGKVDCILGPSVLLVQVIAALLNKGDPLAGLPSLAAYQQHAQAHTVIGPILAETQAALDAQR